MEDIRLKVTLKSVDGNVMVLPLRNEVIEATDNEPGIYLVRDIVYPEPSSGNTISYKQSIIELTEDGVFEDRADNSVGDDDEIVLALFVTPRRICLIDTIVARTWGGMPIDCAFLTNSNYEVQRTRSNTAREYATSVLLAVTVVDNQTMLEHLVPLSNSFPSEKSVNKAPTFHTTSTGTTVCVDYLGIGSLEIVSIAHCLTNGE